MTVPALSLLAPINVAQARRAPPPPTGELILPFNDPVVIATVGGVALRLRVGLEDKNVVELNPAAVARLPIPFATGFEADVGRITLPGISVSTVVTLNGRKFAALLSSHGRECCAGVDGEIGPGLLPYASVRFTNAAALPAPERSFTAEASEEHGIEVRERLATGQDVFVQFSLDRADSVATSSAGVILAKAFSGAFEGPSFRTPIAFGITRPARTIAFGRPAGLAGFDFARLPVRLVDFGGGFNMPVDPVAPDEIVVKKRMPRQRAWPVVLVGRDRLNRCSEISFDTLTLKLALRCANESAVR